MLLGITDGLGEAEPIYEPETSAQGERLRYRTDGGAVMIFALLDGKRLLVLAVAKSASALPTVRDLNLAAQRLKRESR